MSFKKIYIPFLTFFTLLSACSNPSNSESNSETQSDSNPSNIISYQTEYYFESLTGEYYINDSYTITKEEEKGTSINAAIKDFEGFTYEADNENNVISATLSETINTLKVYYSRNTYNVTVYGGVASKTTAKYEETITITSNVEGAEIVLENNSKATLEGNKITMAAEDVFVKCLSKSKLIISNTSFTAKENFSAQVTLNIVDKSNIDGLVFSYISENMSKDGVAKYYVFGTSFEGVGLYLYNNGTLDSIKKAEFSDTLVGNHTFSVKVNANNSIKCYVDGIEVISVTSNDFVSNGLSPISSIGRIGVYSNKYFFDYTDLFVTSGVLTLNQAKAQILKEFKSFKFSQHVIDFNNGTTKEGDVDVYLYNTFNKDKYYAFESNINNASTVEQLDKALEGAYQMRLETQKQYTKDHLMQLLEDVHNGTVLFYAEDGSTTYFDTGITINIDYITRDLRTYVPDAYKLIGAEGSICLLDQLEIDLLNASNESDVYQISDIYALDLVRALCYRNYEYYYWEQYNKYPNSTYPEWDWFLYNYKGSNGEGFVYNGNVFKDYSWNKDYRLNKFLHGTEAMGAFPTIYAVADNTAYMMRTQTIRARSYSIILNADGGTLASYTFNHNSETPFTLPNPTKDGYVFDGWYYSRLLQGNKVTSIPAGNLYDVTLYAAWKKDGVRIDSEILPADYITENMIVQQNKPILISGTGKVGINVTASFNGVDKTTTVDNDGNWEVVFDALEGSFVERTLTISSSNTSYTFKNVVVGEVWLGAGQSNMEMLPVWLNNRGLQVVGKFGQYTNIDKIRIFRQYVDDTPADNEDNNLQDRWAAPRRMQDLFDKSLLSFTFACYLQEKLNVPVGVLTSARGGTYIEEWLSKESLDKVGSSLTGADKSLESRYYNYMTVDLKGLQVAGVLWYQGCNNYLAPELYKSQYAELVNQYRNQLFMDNDLPIIVQQLVQYGAMDFKDFRLMQWELMDLVDNTYVVSGIDTGEQHDIHPGDKAILASRMADVAAEYVYNIGEDSLSYSPIKATRKDGKIVVEFDNKTIRSDKSLKHFSIKKSNGSFANVDASIVNNTIVIDDISDATEVYYAYAGWLGEITLYGGNDKPIAPFKVAIQ